jgi:hypothetical protein
MGHVFTKYSDSASGNFDFSVILHENLWVFEAYMWENGDFWANPANPGAKSSLTHSGYRIALAIFTRSNRELATHPLMGAKM